VAFFLVAFFLVAFFLVAFFLVIVFFATFFLAAFFFVFLTPAFFFATRVATFLRGPGLVFVVRFFAVFLVPALPTFPLVFAFALRFAAFLAAICNFPRELVLKITSGSVKLTHSYGKWHPNTSH
jgi:hypothetical protein